MNKCPVVDPIYAVPPEVWHELSESNHFQDILSGLDRREQRRVRKELRRYEQTGWCSEAIADLFRRAQCIVEADRILARFG